MILKPFLVIITLLAIGVNSFAQDPFSPFNDVKPKGKIDTVIIIYGNAEGKHVYIYNKHRQLIEDIWYDGRISDAMITRFSYDANKRLMSSLRILKGIISSASYQYLSRKYGYAIRVKDSRDQDSSIVYEMRFNHLGQMIQSGNYALNDQEHQLNGNYDYKYDNRGNLINRTRYYGDITPPTTTEIYKYNNWGDEVEVSRHGRGYSRKTTYKYSGYDKMHNWTQRADDFINAYEEDDSIHHESTVTRQITYYK